MQIFKRLLSLGSSKKICHLFKKFVTWSIDRSFNISINQANKQSVVSSVVCSVVRPFGRLVSRSFGCSVVRSFSRSLVRSFGQLFVRLFGPLVSRSFGRSVVQPFSRSPSQSIHSRQLKTTLLFYPPFFRLLDFRFLYFISFLVYTRFSFIFTFFVVTRHKIIRRLFLHRHETETQMLKYLKRFVKNEKRLTRDWKHNSFAAKGMSDLCVLEHYNACKVWESNIKISKKKKKTCDRLL